MEKPTIERYWKGNCLRAHDKISSVYEEIRNDIATGSVFPAIRENEVHLYHEGGRAFRMTPRSIYTHSRYAGSDGNRDIPLRGLAKKDYVEIKGRCSERNSAELESPGAWREGWIVSRLFRRFSCWSKHADRNQPKLVDIEVRFRSSERKSNKIDLLFLEDDGRLRFVEVKRQYDKRVRSKGSNLEVVKQIRRYEDVLRNERDTIIRAYSGVPDFLYEALELERFPAPKDVCPRVPVLVCRKDARDGQDTWLREQLQSCQKDMIGSHLMVDGGSIEPNAYGERRHPSWCSQGLWECLNLREVFQKVDEVS